MATRNFQQQTFGDMSDEPTLFQKESGKVTKKILDRIDKGDAHLYVARTQLSHEKIYLLSHEDGRKRVVMGSDNMSFNAFSGHQRENCVHFRYPKSCRET